MAVGGSLSNTLSHSQVHWHLYELAAVRKVMAMYHLHVHQYGSFLPPFFCIFKGDEKALCCQCTSVGLLLVLWVYFVPQREVMF